MEINSAEISKRDSKECVFGTKILSKDHILKLKDSLIFRMVIFFYYYFFFFTLNICQNNIKILKSEKYFFSLNAYHQENNEIKHFPSWDLESSLSVFL